MDLFGRYLTRTMEGTAFLFSHCPVDVGNNAVTAATVKWLGGSKSFSETAALQSFQTATAGQTFAWVERKMVLQFDHVNGWNLLIQKPKGSASVPGMDTEATISLFADPAGGNVQKLSAKGPVSSSFQLQEDGTAQIHAAPQEAINDSSTTIQQQEAQGKVEGEEKLLSLDCIPFPVGGAFPARAIRKAPTILQIQVKKDLLIELVAFVPPPSSSSLSVGNISSDASLPTPSSREDRVEGWLQCFRGIFECHKQLQRVGNLEVFNKSLSAIVIDVTESSGMLGTTSVVAEEKVISGAASEQSGIAQSQNTDQDGMLSGNGPSSTSEGPLGQDTQGAAGGSSNTFVGSSSTVASAPGGKKFTGCTMIFRRLPKTREIMVGVKLPKTEKGDARKKWRLQLDQPPTTMATMEANTPGVVAPFLVSGLRLPPNIKLINSLSLLPPLQSPSPTPLTRLQIECPTTATVAQKQLLGDVFRLLTTISKVIQSVEGIAWPPGKEGLDHGSTATGLENGIQKATTGSHPLNNNDPDHVEKSSIAAHKDGNNNLPSSSTLGQWNNPSATLGISDEGGAPPVIPMQSSADRTGATTAIQYTSGDGKGGPQRIYPFKRANASSSLELLMETEIFVRQQLEATCVESVRVLVLALHSQHVVDWGQEMKTKLSLEALQKSVPKALAQRDPEKVMQQILRHRDENGYM